MHTPPLCCVCAAGPRRHPALAGEPSQRYARALLDRELAALLLIEAMLAVRGVQRACRAHC